MLKLVAKFAFGHDHLPFFYPKECGQKIDGNKCHTKGRVPVYWSVRILLFLTLTLNQANAFIKMFIKGKSQMIIDLRQLIVCVLTEVSSGGIRISSHKSLSKLLRPHCTVFSFLSLISLAYFWQFVVQVASHSKSGNKYFKMYDFLIIILIIKLNMNSLVVYKIKITIMHTLLSSMKFQQCSESVS